MRPHDSRASHRPAAARSGDSPPVATAHCCSGTARCLRPGRPRLSWPTCGDGFARSTSRQEPAASSRRTRRPGARRRSCIARRAGSTPARRPSTTTPATRRSRRAPRGRAAGCRRRPRCPRSCAWSARPRPGSSPGATRPACSHGRRRRDAAGSARQRLDELVPRHRRPAGHVLLLRPLVQLVAAELLEALAVAVAIAAVATAVGVAVEALTRPRTFERLLQRGHDVRRRPALVARGLRRDDLPALALALDHLEQPLAIAVLVLLGIPVARERLDQRDRRVELRLGRLAPAGVDVLRRAHLVVKPHRRERQDAVAHTHEHEVLLRAHHEPPECGAVGALHDLHEELVRAEVALRLAHGREEVRVVEVDRVDLVDVDERLDVDRPRLARRGGGEVVVGEQHLLAIVELVAMGDRLEGHLLVLLRAEAPGVDRGAVLLVELAEVDVEVAHGAVERDGHVDQAEADRAGPERAGHQRRPFFAPSRLALSVAIRSGASSDCGSSAATISSPLALRLTTSRTASRYSSSYVSGLNFSWSVSMSCAAIFTSRSPGPRLGVATSMSLASTSSSAKRSVWSTSTPSRARTAVRYSRSWKVKRPIPARPVFASASWSRRYGCPPSLPAPSQ